LPVSAPRDASAGSIPAARLSVPIREPRLRLRSAQPRAAEPVELGEQTAEEHHQ
jgi:hypothetical protein